MENGRFFFAFFRRTKHEHGVELSPTARVVRSSLASRLPSLAWKLRKAYACIAHYTWNGVFLVFSRLFRCPGIKACPVSSIPRGRSWTFFRAAFVTDWKIIFLMYLRGSRFAITYLSFSSHSKQKMSSDFSTKIPSNSVLYLFIISIPRITFSSWWSRTAIDVSSAVINIKNF